MTQPHDEYDVVVSHWLDDPVKLVLWLALTSVPFAGLAMSAPWQWYPLAAAYLFFLLWLSSRR